MMPPVITEDEKCSKQSTVGYESLCTKKLKKPLHNVCISISSSSDEDENLFPAPKFLSYAKPYDVESSSSRCAVKPRYKNSLLDVELPDLDCDFPLVAQKDESSNELGNTQQQYSVKNSRNEKMLKSIANDLKNNTRLKQPLKCIHIEIDRSLIGLQDSETLWTSLQNMEINYSFTDNIVNLSILWERERIDYEMSEDDKKVQNVEKYPEDHVLIVFPATSFIEMVQDFKWNLNSGCVTNALLECANHHKTHFPDKDITYAIIGIDRYFREKRNKQNQKYRSLACGKTSECNIQNFFLVSFDDVEEATVCLQVHGHVICHLVDTMTDLAALIASFSKAIAEAPYKKENRQNVFSWYAEADSCKGVKVSNYGESLLQLWAQQIQQFPLVSKEVADAIACNYPSPQLLIQAYQSCRSIQEAEKLLKDIVIRRGVGPLATTRHVGPELSRKIFHFFTKEDGAILL